MTINGAEHDAFEPPFAPLHVHANGPDPDTLDALPDEQSPDDGAAVVPTPFALPHAPFTATGAQAIPLTVTGTLLLAIAPLPSCPDAPLPQHLIVPSPSVAQV